MSESAAISIRSLCCVRGGQRVLDDVSFDVRKGQYVTLLGPNGAGKSTLLQCVLRQAPIERGRVEVLGQPAEGFAPKAFGRAVAHVPQQLDYPVEFSVREFALLSRYPHLSPFSAPGRGDYEAADEALEAAGIADLAERPLRRLSGGERRLACIAAALAQGADILLLDEPLAHLDYRYRVRVQELLRNLHKRDERTLLVVTHDVDAGVFAGDRAVALRQGRVVFDDSPTRLIEDGTLEAIYDTAFERLRDADGRPVVTPRGTPA
jgi:iron complex transport system ATP-binding protein